MPLLGGNIELAGKEANSRTEQISQHARGAMCDIRNSHRAEDAPSVATDPNSDERQWEISEDAELA